MGGMKGGPTTLLGGGGEASGGNYSSNASLKTGEGWPAGSSSAYPTGGAPSGGSGEGLKPLAEEGGRRDDLRRQEAARPAKVIGTALEILAATALLVFAAFSLLCLAGVLSAV
jgi:hypothetical protein